MQRRASSTGYLMNECFIPSLLYIPPLLARGITLVESTSKTNAAQARILVNKLITHCKQKTADGGGKQLAFRIGLSGPPGAGKSSLTEVLGKKLTGLGHRVAVLAVDPSSGATGGNYYTSDRLT